MRVKEHNLNLENKQINRLLKILKVSKIEEIEPVILKRLKEELKKLTDTRQKCKTHYKIWDVAMYVIIANFANNYDWNDIHDFIEYKKIWFDYNTFKVHTK